MRHTYDTTQGQHKSILLSWSSSENMVVDIDIPSDHSMWYGKRDRISTSNIFVNLKFDYLLSQNLSRITELLLTGFAIQLLPLVGSREEGVVPYFANSVN